MYEDPRSPLTVEPPLHCTLCRILVYIELQINGYKCQVHPVAGATSWCQRDKSFAASICHLEGTGVIWGEGEVRRIWEGLWLSPEGTGRR